MDTKTAYTYFAFISYKHDGKDAEFANDLQKTLGEFKLPVSIVDKEPGLKDGVKPVFVDMTELGDHPTLSPAIKKALRESRFLIVICSPRSAKSEWVDKEIQYFVMLKRTKRIIPFIIEGCPNSKDENEECCTPTMKELMGEQDLLGISINELGFDVAVVKVVSRMFKVRFSSLWNIYEKEREKRQRELKEQNDRIMIAQSRFVAEKALSIAEEDSYLARLLALEVLPKDLENPDRPYTVEAEYTLRMAAIRNSAILKGHNDTVRSAFPSPNGKRIVSSSFDNTRIWDVKTGNELSALKCSVRAANSDVFSHDGMHIVTASHHTICVFDIETGQELLELKGHCDIVTSAVFSPDGARIVSASKDKTIRIWDAETGKELMVLTGHHDIINSAVFSPDGTRIVSASSDRTIRVWDFKTGEELMMLKGHLEGVITAVFNPDGTRIVSASVDKTIRVWDVETGKKLMTLKGHQDIVRSAIYSPDGTRIISTSCDRTIRIWNSETGNTLEVLNGRGKLLRHYNNINSAVFSPEGTHVIATLDDEIRIVSLEMGKKLIFSEMNDNNHESVNLNSNESIVVTLSLDNEGGFRILNTETGDVLREMDPNENCSNDTISPDGTYVVMVSWDNIIGVLNTENRREIVKIGPINQERVVSAVFSKDRRHIIAGYTSGIFRMWDFLPLQELINKTRERFKDRPLTAEERKQYYLE